MTTLGGNAVAPWTDRAAWDRFVDESPHGSVFVRSAFLDALGMAWDVVRLGDDDLPSIAAVLLRDDAGVVMPGPLPFTQYQGVLVARPVAEAPPHRRVKETLDLTAALMEGLRGEQRLSWCLHPGFTDVRAFLWFNYHSPEQGHCRLDVRYSGLIDTSGGLPGVLARCRSVRRQEFRKASSRFRVASILDLDVLDRLHAETFARQGLERTPREVATMRSIASAALRHGFGDLLAAYDEDGTVAGAALFLFDRRTAYYLVAANDPAYRSAGVSTLLLLSGVERGITRGVRQVDVVGMNSPLRGDFKASFGAEPVPHYLVNWERP